MKTMTSIRELLLAGTILWLVPVASQASPILLMPETTEASEKSSADPSALLLVAPESTPFHGFTIRLTREGRVVVAACHYDGGTPVTGAQVTLYPPGSDTPYQTGVTDRAGVFAFLPESPGEWRVLVDDGMGHRREASIQTAATYESGAGSDDHGAAGSGADQAHTHVSGGAELSWKLATGLSLIVGLTGFAYGFTARRPQGR